MHLNQWRQSRPLKARAAIAAFTESFFRLAAAAEK
jgi:hypothetical protein